MEPYHAIGVTIAPSAMRRNSETEADTVREWAKSFCAAASRDFQWDHRWRLVVYAHGQPHRSYSCVIPVARAFNWTSSEGPVACDDKSGSLVEPVDELE